MHTSWEIWRFSETFVSDERRGYLGEEIKFECIVEAIVNEIAITKLCVNSKPYNPKLKGCKRPEFQFHVEPKTFDLFYNSPWGYRGQYCLGADVGLEKNRYLLDSILDRLITHARSNPTEKLSIMGIENSLRMNSAKIWIGENGQIDPKDSALREELLCSVWLRNAREARAALDENKEPDPQEKSNAITGVRAPEGKLLEIKGAWISQDGEEHIDDYKRYRAEHIRDYGFS